MFRRTAFVVPDEKLGGRPAQLATRDPRGQRVEQRRAGGGEERVEHAAGGRVTQGAGMQSQRGGERAAAETFRRDLPSQSSASSRSRSRGSESQTASLRSVR